MIIRCGEYPNVPLLGTQEAINYNPELTSRQVGYPMIRAPLKETIMPFVIHGSKAHKGEHHKKIRHAWKNGRTKLVWLPYGKVQYQDQEARAYEVQETLRVGELEEALKQMKTEQGSLKRRLEVALEEVCLERQLKNETNKRARVEKETRLKRNKVGKASPWSSRKGAPARIGVSKSQTLQRVLRRPKTKMPVRIGQSMRKGGQGRITIPSNHPRIEGGLKKLEMEIPRDC
ncbi:hypothetical protein CR513_14333, partial [Mucuna pruriens]